MANRQRVTNEKLALLMPFVPPPPRRADGQGRPVEHDDRAVMDDVLWILRTGAVWADLPNEYPSYATCFRRFRGWVKDGDWPLVGGSGADLEAGGDIGDGAVHETVTL